MEKMDFIKRNIELASTGDGMTVTERERVEDLLAVEGNDGELNTIKKTI